MYYEVNSQAEENALTLANGDIVVRLDLLPTPPAPPPPPPPAGTVIAAYTLTPETNFASAALTAPDSNDLDFGTGNFEINFDFKLANLSTANTHQTFFSKGAAGNLNAAWYIMYTAGNFMISTSNNNAIIYVASGITTINTWFNLKLKRINGTTTLYLNDVSKGTTTLPLIDTNGLLYIGAWNYTPSSHRFLGSMRNVVITKG
jgi:hypothetical protein